MARKLVTIQEIKTVSPIRGADLIETVSFKNIGWKCVSKKGDFNPGDRCLYFEIDSFLPIEEKYEFLRKSSYRKMYTGQEGFCLKTVELRKQVSQGLALPISLFPEFKDFEVGTDVTEFTNVIKFEKDYEDEEDLKDGFPGFVEKSDQTRIQNLLHFFDEYKDVEFEESLKLDGKSITLYMFEQNIGICSRTAEYNLVPSVQPWDLTVKKGLDIALKELKRNIGLQFEFMGPGILGNRENLLTHELFLYNIYDINNSKFFKPNDRYEIFEQLEERVKEISGQELKHTPIINKKVKILEICPSLEFLLERVKAPSLNHKICEGRVFKSNEYIDNERCIQFKIINNEYLLKGGN
jgi:RNA ligase (TIGR02306 family)